MIETNVPGPIPAVPLPSELPNIQISEVQNKIKFNKWGLILGILSAIILLIAISLIIFSYAFPSSKLIQIVFYDSSGQPKTAIKASDPKENFRTTRGIRAEKDIPENFGIVFKFDHSSKSPYWMKDMLFPIDIIWIENNKVVDFKENLKVPFPGQPPESLRLYRPISFANSAIEVKAGFIKKFNIQKGDSIKETALK